MIITRTYEFDMGHRLQAHPGLCRNVHGHRYVVHVSVKGTVDRTGMVMDFKTLDHLIRRILEPWDHALMLETDDPVYSLLRNSMLSLRLVPVDWPPTAENIAQEIVKRMRHALLDADFDGISLDTVVVAETPRSSATAL